MKKLILIFFVSATLIIITFSCKKTSELEPGQYSHPMKMDRTERLISDFLNNPSNPLKDEKMYSTDSAIWYTEAALNFSYSIYDSLFMYRVIDASDFYFELDQNHQVTQTELESVYAEMVDVLEEYFDAMQESTKHLFYCDVEERGVDGNHFNVTLYSVIACGYSGYQWSHFDETDYWYSIPEWGKCNYYEGEGDAAIQLTTAFMTPLTASDPQVRIWFSDEITIPEVDPHSYPYQPAPHNYRAFWYYGTGQMTNPQCLDPDEMEFYMSENGIPYIINDQNPDPVNLDFVAINIPSNGYSPGVPYWIEAHIMDLTYGVKHESLIPASGL